MIHGSIVLLASMLLCACPENAAPATALKATPPPTAAAILAKAQQAHGGAAALTAVTSLHVRSLLSRGVHGWESEVHFSLPGCFLQRIDTGDVVITHGCDGNVVWAALDGTLVPLSDAERATLQEQSLLLRPDFLVRFGDAAHYTISTSEGPPGLLHIQSRPRKGPGGPWRMSFDPLTSLLAAIILQPDSAGRTTELRFSDYRNAGLVKTPWLARWFHDGVETATNCVTTLEHSIAIDAGIYTAPVLAPPAIHEGTLSAAPTLRVTTQDWAQGAAALDDFLHRSGVERAGPMVAECMEGKITSMSLGITVLPEPFCGPLAEDAVMACLQPRSRHLRLLMTGKDMADILSRPHDLREEASRRGLTPLGPLRVVQWGTDFWILQLPLEN